MVDRKVRLKNLDGDYLYPYTDNIPAATANVAGKVKVDTLPVSGSVNAISSGAVFQPLQTNWTRRQQRLKLPRMPTEMTYRPLTL